MTYSSEPRPYLTCWYSVLYLIELDSFIVASVAENAPPAPHPYRIGFKLWLALMVCAADLDVCQL